MALHKALGKVLRAFEHGTSLRRADNGHVLYVVALLKVVVYALYQWILGANHHHVHPMGHHKVGHGVKVVGLDGHILTGIGCAGVARCNVEFVDEGALCYFPCQCVLAAATAQK